jgi:hypothetical protein
MFRPARHLRFALALSGLLGLFGAVPPVAAQESAIPQVTPPPETVPVSVANGAGVAPPEGASALADGAPAQVPRSKPAKPRRGGVHPCMTPDPGFGVYSRWASNISMGQYLAPEKGGVTKAGSFDVIVHFHGHEAVRKEFVKTADGIVLVGIDLGIGSGAYQSAFASPTAFTELIRTLEVAIAKKTGKKKAHARHIALSAWSAGYGAIEQILRQPAGKRVDSVVLLDSLHAGYADESAKTLKVAQIQPFIDFAKEAAGGDRFMFMSHSSIIPPGYASTTEVAHYVVKQLRGKPKKANREDVLGLDMIDRYDRRKFHMRGYTGEDKPDHCAHLGLMADVVRVHLEPRWKTPQGRK